MNESAERHTRTASFESLRNLVPPTELPERDRALSKLGALTLNAGAQIDSAFARPVMTPKGEVVAIGEFLAEGARTGFAESSADVRRNCNDFLQALHLPNQEVNAYQPRTLSLDDVHEAAKEILVLCDRIHPRASAGEINKEAQAIKHLVRDIANSLSSTDPALLLQNKARIFSEMNTVRAALETYSFRLDERSGKTSPQAMNAVAALFEFTLMDTQVTSAIAKEKFITGPMRAVAEAVNWVPQVIKFKLGDFFNPGR